MRKLVVFVLSVVVGGSILFAVPVKKDPSQLPLNRLAQYFNKRRNLDRWLQTGRYGLVIKHGKEVLKDFVQEDAYAAYCIAAAYGSMEPDPEEEEDFYAESLEFLDKAIEWGFRNVQILETSEHFANLRNDKEKKKDFQEIIAYLKKLQKEEKKRAQRGFPKEIKKAIAAGEKPVFSLEGAKPVGDKKVKPEALSGKPVLVFVLRPFHDGVADALPGLKELAGEAEKKGVYVVGAIYNYYWTPHLEKQAAAFTAVNKLPFPCVMVDRAWSKKYGVLTLPSHLLVSAKGKVLYRIDGWQHDKWRLETLLEVLLEVGK